MSIKNDPGATSVFMQRLSGAGTTVGGLNLITLCFIGWQAKGAFDEQFEQLDQARTEFSQKTEELEKKIGSLAQSVELISAVRSDTAALQNKVAELEVELAKVHAELKQVEDCAQDRRKCKP